MMDQQVFVFGSFTEDEALSFQAPTSPPQSAKAPGENKPVTIASPKLSASSEGPKPNGHANILSVVTEPVKPSQGSDLKEKSSIDSSTSLSPTEVAAELRSVSLHSEKPHEFEVVEEATLAPVVAAFDTLQTVPKSWAALVGIQPDSGRRIAAADTKESKGTGNGEVAAKSFLPRGLVNTGNTCFLNSTLQALLSCSPFWELLKILKAQTIPEDGFPLLHAFASFAGEFEDTSPSQGSQSSTYKYYRKGEEEVKLNKDVEVGKPLTPSMFDPILQSFNPEQPATGAPRSRQEDAQEFLSFLMNQMHEELIKLDGRDKQSVANTVDEDEWETVGPKNRTAFTRTYSVKESALSEIFGGQQQSVVKAKGLKPSATVEPFYLLHLDIISEAVHSVDDALRYYAAPESLEGYKSATGKTEDASRSVKIRSLPKVLILHLMRFSYGAKGTGKLHKPIRFPGHLTLGRELLASPYGPGSEARRYELIATVSHHGKDPSVGHYTADTKQPDGQWLRFDDRAVSLVSLNRVLHDQAYVLFYRRLQQ